MWRWKKIWGRANKKENTKSLTNDGWTRNLHNFYAIARCYLQYIWHAFFSDTHECSHAMDDSSGQLARKWEMSTMTCQYVTEWASECVRVSECVRMTTKIIMYRYVWEEEASIIKSYEYNLVWLPIELQMCTHARMHKQTRARAYSHSHRHRLLKIHIFVALATYYTHIMSCTEP